MALLCGNALIILHILIINDTLVLSLRLLNSPPEHTLFHTHIIAKASITITITITITHT